jgi:hypothetical protein
MQITLGSRWKTKGGLVVKVVELKPFGCVELQHEGRFIFTSTTQKQMRLNGMEPA